MVSRLIFVIAGGLAIITFLNPSWYTFWEDTNSYYSTYDEAKRAMDVGWLPAYMPKSSTEIHEQHNIDSNLVYATFNYNPDEAIELSIFCPRNLRLSNGFRYFCNDGSGSVVIDLYDNGTGIINHDNESRF